MNHRLRTVVSALLATMLLLVPLPASAQPPPPFDAFEFTRNMHPQGFSPNPDTINSDLAFWGKLAFQGEFNGFRVIDIRSPARSPSRSALATRVTWWSGTTCWCGPGTLPLPRG
jgi:hypothetical protein